MSTEPISSDAWIGLVEAPGRVRRAFDKSASELGSQTVWEAGTWGLFEEDGGTARAVGTPLAAKGSALADLYALAARRGLDPLHPAAVRTETQRWVARPGIDDASLVDLTHLPFITIDEVHSKDLDQAVFVEARDDGFTVWYAIADPSHFIRPGSALFSEALSRGSTFYLPGLVIPMLPKALSEDLISINPRVDRRAMVFEVRLDREARVESTQLHRARVQSRVKTSYDAVQAFYDGEAPVPGGPHPGSPPPPEEKVVATSLEALREVGWRRMQLAEARDVIAFRRQEIAVSLAGSEGLRFVAMADPRNEVERYNEQISLLCNMEGARFLLEGDREDDEIQPIYRVHDPPTAERLAALGDQIAALVRLHGLDEHRWGWRRGQGSLADYLKGLPSTGPLARLARAVHRQAMLTGGRSLFATTPGSHFGVGADIYGRFTAPMREVVGIFAHKEAWEKRFGRHEIPPPPWDDDTVLRKRVIEAANRSREIQRKLDREANGLVIDQLFGEDASRPVEDRPLRRGTVLGVAKAKVHVGLDDPPIDVKAYHRHLEAQNGGQRLSLGRDGITLRRHEDGARLYAVGEEVQVRVEGRDHERGRWRLELLPQRKS